MDKITESLRTYLEAADIPHQTFFNEKGFGYPCTSTCFHKVNEGLPHQRLPFNVNIYSGEAKFYIVSAPMWVCHDKALESLKPLESKWNRCGMMTTLVFEEERGVSVPNIYGFHLELPGICESDGLGKDMWKRYFEIVERDACEVFENIRDLLGLSDEPDGTDDADDLPF